MKPLFLLLFTILFNINSFAQTTILENITHDGIQRDYRLYVPSIYDGLESVPLIINLHGYTSNAFEQEVYGDFRPIADTANFILVHPDGTLDNTGTTFWNAFGSPTETVDDIGFLSALIDSIALDYNINPNRIYSTGMSNGGFMSYTLACQLSNRIAAIASVTGTMITLNLNACNAQHPTPVMQVHGTADPTVPYLGNPQGFVAVEDLIAFWTTFNNCNSTAVEMSVPDIDQADGCNADHFVYSGGDFGASVELYRINGGGHTWPGSNPFFAIGVTNQDFSASAEIWRFFSQYSLNDFVDVNEEVAESEKTFSVYPNPSSGEVSLQFQNTNFKTVQIHNSLGQMVLDRTGNNRIMKVNLTQKGVFLLTVIDEEGISTQKLIRK